MSTPEQALQYFQSLEPSGMRLGLQTMQEALRALGDPQTRYRTVHVAGTNGKGSTCAFTAACLQAAGYRVGLYTSPHLVRVNERIRVAGEDISDALLAQRILEILERCPSALVEPSPLTFFELGTLVAFWHFQQEHVDVVVLETGLGGRLDATSAGRPDVTAITPISFDHTEYLGTTLAQIAHEKAGIFKPRVPIISSRQAPEALAVIEARAKALEAPVFLDGRDFSFEPPLSAGEGPQRYTYRGPRWTVPDLALGLRGPHQAQNAAVAIACLEALEAAGLAVQPSHVRDGLLQVRWPGRLEEVAHSPTVLLDGAHNPAGAQTLIEALDALYLGRRIHLVFAVLADKDHGPMLQTLFPRCASVHLTPVSTPRSLAPERYVQEARAWCPDVSTYSSVADALSGARAKAGISDVILCAGSLYLVGQAKAALWPKG